MEILRKRNAGTTIYFPMMKAGSQDFATSSDWTPVAGDIQFSVDGAAFANPNTTTPTEEGNGMWSLALLAGEVDGKVTMITVIDSATKAVEDQAILISTVGDDSAQLSYNVIADHVLRRTAANARASSNGDSVTFRSLLGAISKLVNRVGPSGSNLITYEENDGTPFGTQVATKDAGADPITELNTT